MESIGSVRNNTLIFVTSQGCGILPSNVKSILKTKVDNIDLFADFNRVNVMISCKGRCAIDSAVYTNDEYEFLKEFKFPSTGKNTDVSGP